MTSSTPARVKRTIVAAAGKARVKAGSAMWESALRRVSMSQSSSESTIMNPVIGVGPKPSMRPLSGATPSFMENSNCSSIASQNAAMARPATLTTRTDVVQQRIALQRRHHAERHAERDRQRDRGQGEFQGGRQARRRSSDIGRWL